MKNKFLFLTFITLSFITCDKRECECSDDLKINYESSLSSLDFDLQVPNAVLQEGIHLTFHLTSNEVIDWTDQYIKLSKGNQIFIETNDLSEFLTYDNVLSFPHENFFLDNGDFLLGPLSVELNITTENISSVQLEGTIYYYNCQSFDKNFGQEDCRWPSQVLALTHYQFPC